ncbi:MAG TPA: peptidoglycan DD-metalloendopeptidase family protein [Candidatus Acidoferrales bacterium]|nr:peptidoglycan DD-metalloendopeptidase family protein [Candidatus Acidoferrales bacterium]
MRLRRAVPALVFAALAALVVAAVPATQAQDSLEVLQRKQLEDIRRQASEKRAAADALKPRETRALGDLRRTDRELALSRHRLTKLQQRQQSLGAQLVVTRANLERSRASLAIQLDRLRHRLRLMYEYGPARELETILSTESFAQLISRWDFLNMVAEQDRVLLDDVRAQKEQVERSQRQLETNITDVRRTATRTTRESTTLAGLRVQKAKVVASIQSQRQEYEAAAAELERTARRIQALLAQLEKRRREESERAKVEGRNPQPYSGNFALGQGQLDWPVRGELVGHFGIETHPRFGTQIHNDGIDIAAPIGTPVKAVAKGRVDFANDDYEGMGGMVVLNHGDGYYTLYGHLNEVLVQSGQEVAPGTVIGRVGDAGSLKGPILHFEVRKGSAPLNPESWLR